VRVFDPTIVAGRPIDHHYFANGFDQTYDLFAYDRATRTLHLGLRVAGAIGDPDGDGNADAAATAATIIDEAGIGVDDFYSWTLRTQGAPSGATGGIAITVSRGEVSVRGAAGATGEFAVAGSELEVVVRGVDLPPSFEARVAVGNLGDGLGEDTHTLGAGDEVAIAIADEPDPIGIKPGGVPIAKPGDGGNGTSGATAAGSDADATTATDDAAHAGRVGANGANATDASAVGGLVAAPDAVSDGIAVLGRAYPNPFSASVTFGFEVKAAGQSVDVGVYDVSGRLVTRLASGPREAGRASVQWDGRDDGGVRMAPGVYFLKANVGGVSKVQRLVRVD
jgi:hypothetical protein